MIVWGAKGEVVNLGLQASKHCPTCEKERPFHLMLQYTARHIWYVFRWVTGKQYAVVCDVCHRGNKVEAHVVEAKLAKPPIPFGTRWGWAFLAGIFAVMAVFGTIEGFKSNSERDTYLAAPQKGDRYIVNAASLLKSPQSKYLYGALRVRNVGADSVEFDAATVFYSGASSVAKDIRNGKLDEAGYLSPSPILLSRAEITRLHQEHAIHSIERSRP